ncbi:GSCOCG00012791001-RA-CDS, partial [Cotesia congregata]
MVVTEKTPLPTEEELTVPEINLSWPVLHAASFYLGKYCENQNNVKRQINLIIFFFFFFLLEFMLCRTELDEIKCLNEGKAVTACAFDFLRKLKKHCYQEFDQYYNCVYKSSRNSSFMP